MSRHIDDVESYIQYEMSNCVHFTGIQNKLCKAGVDIRELVGGPDFGWGARLPCMLMDKEKCEVTCPSRRFPSREEAEKTVTEDRKRTQDTLLAVACCHDAAEKKGLKAGHGGVGAISCPICNKGQINYSVASVNGHMWAKCTTPDCVSWME